MISMILGFIAKPFTTVIERLIPDKNKQAEAKQQFELEVLKQVGEQGKQFEQRILAEIQHPNWMRDAVRPIITYFSFFLYAYIKITIVVVTTKMYYPLLVSLEKATASMEVKLTAIRGLLGEYTAAIFTEFDFYLLLTVFSFWFGGKLLERVSSQMTGTGGLKGFLFGLKDDNK